MDWIALNNQQQLQEINEEKGFSIIFKHSTRCSISMMAKRRFEQDWNDLPEDTIIYFLDLINYRGLSGQIAELFQVHHESPQLLLIKDGECLLHQSHSDISVDEVNEVLELK
ncbi:MAG TPA: bacillithiol system redox-active protein YtxJ [Sphingobacteriaceae bacterium]|nr:bacillithiol system redox-active protein YtxJ [Sphingobacteriaceae bacterium]